MIEFQFKIHELKKSSNLNVVCFYHANQEDNTSFEIIESNNIHEKLLVEIYNGSTQNISDAQINSQIQILNEDFRRLNSDADNTWPQAADAEIEFCMASVDPNGNSTSGITRTSTNVNGFGTNDAVKFNSSGGKDAWPAGDYLNIWAVSYTHLTLPTILLV